MKRERIFTLIPVAGILVCMVLVLLTISGTTAEDSRRERELIIGYVEMAGDSWKEAVNRSVREEAEKQGFSLLVMSADNTQESQREALRALVAYEADLIVFSPVITRGWDDVLREIRDAGIPVVLLGESLDTQVRDVIKGYVGASYRTLGNYAGGQLRRHFRDSGRTVNIVEFSGFVGSSVSQQLSGGLREEIGRAGDLKIIYTVSTNNMRSKARELMRNYLMYDHSRPDIDVFVSFSDAVTYGALEAMEEAGKRPGKDVYIISIGGEDEAFRLLNRGVINCEITAPSAMGEELFKTLREVLETGENAGSHLIKGNLYTSADQYGEESV